MKRVWVNTFNPALSTESAEKFESLEAKFRNDIKPQDEIERMYCHDFANLFWEIMRLRRVVRATWQFGLRDALDEVLIEKLDNIERNEDTGAFLDGWFTDKEVRRDVLERLEQFGLDESALEAEVFCQRSAWLMQLEQLLARTEARRDRVLLNIGLYRRSLAAELRSNAIDVEGKVLRLEKRQESSRG